jgi:hypothetical protein
MVDGKADLRQPTAHAVGDQGVIFDDEYAHAGTVAFLPSFPRKRESILIVCWRACLLLAPFPRLKILNQQRIPRRPLVFA